MITLKPLPIDVFGQKLIGVFDGETLLAFTNKEHQDRLVRALRVLEAVELETVHEKFEPKFEEYIDSSSWIEKIGYDSKNQLMSITKDSDPPEPPIIHKDVPREIFSTVLSANSVGGAYNKLVR